MNIVQQAAEKISQEMSKQFVGIQNHQLTFATLVANIHQCVNEIGVAMLETLIQEADYALRQSPVRKREWHIQRNEDTKICATLLGPVKLTRTYYKHKKDGHFSYLLDNYLGILSYDRIDIGLESKLLETATERSYQQTVEQFQYSGITSKETIKNVVRRFNTEELAAETTRKSKTPTVLFIEADEDHVSYQDGTNRYMKLVYVHEGYETTVGKNSRKKLKNYRYFSGLYPDGSKLWEEVYDYLAETYDLKQVQQIYFSGDGARWIQEGVKFIPNTTFVLDRFHMVKYVKKACIGMTTGASILLDWIEKDYKSYVEAFFTSQLSDPTLSVNQQKNKKGEKLFIRALESIQRQKDKNYIGCSAEGHVSHVLSLRLSSRPLGWSKTGTNNIAKIRVFLKNKGNLTVHLEMKTKEIQRKRAIHRLDKRVTNSNKVFNPYFLAKFPLLENGLITGTRNRVARALK